MFKGLPIDKSKRQTLSQSTCNIARLIRQTWDYYLFPSLDKSGALGP